MNEPGGTWYKRRKKSAVKELYQELKEAAHREALPAACRIILERAGIAEGLQSVDPDSRTITLQLDGSYWLPGLPEGYSFKGGAAREQLRFVLSGKKQKIKPRDYDLVRDTSISDALDHELSLRFMADDYEFGRGVEVIEDYRTYFITRDLTVNEALAWNKKVRATFRCVEDIAHGVLRPTEYVMNKAGEILSATIAKALRLAAEASVNGAQVAIEYIEPGSRVTFFDIALNLDRSLARNEAVAQEYLHYVWQYKLCFTERFVPPDTAEAILFLSKKLPQGIHLFKHIPGDILLSLGSRIH